MMHKLKIIDSFFEAVVRGDKKSEIRNNSDRGFQRGDLISFNEVNKEGNASGRQQLVEITYVSNYMQPANQVVFDFKLAGEIINDG